MSCGWIPLEVEINKRSSLLSLLKKVFQFSLLRSFSGQVLSFLDLATTRKHNFMPWFLIVLFYYEN